MNLKQRKELLYPIFILFFLLVPNYRLLDTWFIIDDTANIFCSSFSAIKLLFEKETYCFFSQLFFTPLLPISFKIDWHLFKLNPTGYHLHNLLVAFAGCVFFYKIQRLYISPFFSWLGTVLLAISLPMVFDIGWITRRHYLWGFLLSLIAFYLFKRWEENKKPLYIFLSVVSTFACLLFKEAYGFLPAVIFIASTGSAKERMKKTIPYFFVLGVYLLWRIYMLDGLGGYPGSTGKTFFFFVQKLFLMPTDLSENLFGFSLLPILLLALLSFLGFRVMISLIASALIVISPFVLYPESGFLLANKALFYVALISFTLSYFMDRISLRNKGFAVTALLFIFIPLSFGAIYKTRDAREAIIRLSENYKKASEEILDNRNEKILIVGGYSYFFSNLEDIYTKMMKTSFPHIVSISDIMFLPYMSSFDFDKVIVTKDFDLNPGRAVMSSVDIVKGIEAKKFIKRELGVYERKISLPPPHVDFIPASDHLKIDIIDPRIGTYVRCLRMESYIGCYPIPPKYTFRYNKVKKIEKIDIIYISGEGEMSQPVTFNKFR